MSITTNLFFILTALLVVIYYILPGRFQWIILLVSSYGFYAYVGWDAVLYLLIVTVVSFVCARKISRVDVQDENYKEAMAIRKKYASIGVILIILLFFIVIFSKRYSVLLHGISGGKIPLFRITAPLGFTYIVLLAMSYLLDVYWEHIPVETNIFKVALYIAFFPQMFQGPVGRYGKLRSQYEEVHVIDSGKMKYGLTRIAWGLFKKMIIAEWLAVYVDAVFDDPDKLAGITIFGVVMYSIELYADFSGGIDIAIGIGELFGITLEENFKQPLFATSISNLWHRWHVSLGNWFLDYVFYPVMLTKTVSRFQKFCKKIFGRKRGRGLAIAAGSMLCFMGVSFWHGLGVMAVAWGVYNGLLEPIAAVWGPEFQKMKNFFHLNDQSRGYHIFMIFRTFALFNIMNYFDCVSSFKELFHVIRLSVTHFDLSQFMLISAGKLGTAYTPYALLTIAVSCMIWHYISIRIERGMNFREVLAKKSLPVITVLIVVLLVAVGLFSPMTAARGFIYAQF